MHCSRSHPDMFKQGEEYITVVVELVHQNSFSVQDYLYLQIVFEWATK
jgi:hypothetical protein